MESDVSEAPRVMTKRRFHGVLLGGLLLAIVGWKGLEVAVIGGFAYAGETRAFSVPFAVISTAMALAAWQAFRRWSINAVRTLYALAAMDCAVNIVMASEPRVTKLILQTIAFWGILWFAVHRRRTCFDDWED